MTTAEGEGSPGDDPVDKMQGGNHAVEEETEEAVAVEAGDSGSSPDTGAFRMECGRQSRDEAKDGGSKMSCLAVAGDLPKYDDDEGGDDPEDHELEGDDAEDHKLEGDDGGYDTDKNKSRGKHHAAVPLDAERVNRSCMLLVSLLLLVAMPFEAWSARRSGRPTLRIAARLLGAAAATHRHQPDRARRDQISIPVAQLLPSRSGASFPRRGSSLPVAVVDDFRSATTPVYRHSCRRRRIPSAGAFLMHLEL